MAGSSGGAGTGAGSIKGVMVRGVEGTEGVCETNCAGDVRITSGGTTPTLTDPEVAPDDAGAGDNGVELTVTRRAGVGIDSTTRIASANGMGRRALGITRVVSRLGVVRMGGGGARTGRRLTGLLVATTFPGFSENIASEIILSRPDQAAILPEAIDPAFATVGLTATGCAEANSEEPAARAFADADSASFFRMLPVPSEGRIILRRIFGVDELFATFEPLEATVRFAAGFVIERFA